VIPSFKPMPLMRAREPFDHPDWIFELKYDGFRALAFANGAGTRLVSRRGLEYRRFDDLRSEISLELNADDAVVDGEIVKLDSEGRPIFVDLMRCRGPFTFVAFDVLVVNGKDVRKLGLTDRKKILRAIVPRESRSVLYAQHVKGRGRELFDVICKQDLEGIVVEASAESVRNRRTPAVDQDQECRVQLGEGSGRVARAEASPRLL